MREAPSGQIGCAPAALSWWVGGRREIQTGDISYAQACTVGLPTGQTPTTEQEMALVQCNGTVNAPGFVITCSRGTRPMMLLRRCLPSAASSAVPGWIIGDVMIDAEEWGSDGDRGRRKGSSIYDIPQLALPFILNMNNTQCRTHAACLPSSIV